MVKTVQDGGRRHAVGPVKAMPLALQVHRNAGVEREDRAKKVCGRPRLQCGSHDHRVRRKWSSVKGIIKSRHSRLSVPINLSHSELACGL